LKICSINKNTQLIKPKAKKATYPLKWESMIPGAVFNLGTKAKFSFEDKTSNFEEIY